MTLSGHATQQMRSTLPLIFLILASAALGDELVDSQDNAAPADTGLSPESVEALGATVGEIRLYKHNVFDLDNPEENNALFRMANRLHIVTKDKVITKQLLLKPGDPFSARLLEESERILRRNRYFYDASIKIDGVEGDVVNLEVETRDIWTLLPDISLSRSGGENRTKIGVEDTNLLGRGQSIRFARIENVDRDSNSFEFSDRHLGRSWVSGFLRLDDNSDGHSRLLSLVRPFEQLDSRWSAGFSVLDDDRRSTLYEQGDEAAEFQHDRQLRTAFLGWSGGLRDGWVRRYTAGIVQDENRFTQVATPTLPAAIPADRDLLYPFVGIEILEDRFEESSNRNQIGRTEDFFLGTRLYLQLGVTSESTGSDRDAIIFYSAFNKGFGSIARTALLLSATSSGRFESGDSVNMLTTFSADYFHRQSEKRLFVTALSGAVGHDLDLDNPVRLGGDSGLRGYPLRYQNGDSKLLFRMEQRYFTDWYPFRLFRVGGAVFFDVGRVWGENPVVEEDREWLKDAGLGLRLAPTRGGTTKIIHLDLAFPLDGDASIDDVQILLEAKRTF